MIFFSDYFQTGCPFDLICSFHEFLTRLTTDEGIGT